jgi:hypothetical protein
MASRDAVKSSKLGNEVATVELVAPQTLQGPGHLGQPAVTLTNRFSAMLLRRRDNRGRCSHKGSE